MNPWVILAEIGITIGLWALNKYLTNTPDTRTKYLQDAPTATEGSPINILIGRRRITNPTFVWYGGFRDRGPIEWGGISEPDGTVHYGINVLVNLGIPMGTASDWASHCKLWGIYVGDKYLYMPLTDGQGQLLSSSGGTLPPDQLYSRDLNLTGYVQFFGGGVAQQISTNAPGAPSDFGTFTDLTEIAWFMRRSRITSGQPDPTTIPGYRGQMLVALSGKHDFLTYDQNAGSGDFWDAFFVGQDPHIPQLSFEASSYRNRYNSNWSTVVDADPASAMYDILTQDWGKLNIDPARIDDASFGGASSVLLGEKCGYSRVIDTLRDAKEVLQEMVNHVCGVLYMDPLTAQIHLKLIRNDYDVNTILSLAAADVLTIDECTVGNWRDTVNQVRIKYYDRKLMYGEAIAVDQNMASAVMQDTVFGDLTTPGGNVRSVTVEYPGCCTYALAQQFASRDLRLLSQPLQKLRATFTRKARQLRPGDVFKLTFPDYPALATAVVFRVTAVDLGQLGDGKVVVDAVQDVFSVGVSAGGYTPPKSEIFIPQASPITRRKVTEQPRWILNYLKATGAVHDADVQRLLTAGYPDDGAAQYQSQTLPLILAILGGNFSVDMGLVANAVYGSVHTTYGRELGPYDTTTGLVVDSLPSGFAALGVSQLWSPSQIRSQGYNLVLVGDEVIAYETMTDLSGTGIGPWRLNSVWRGLLDSAARDHLIGEGCFWIGTAFAIGEFCGHFSFADNVGPISVQLNARLGILTGSGEDPIDSITIRGRHGLPTRIANPRICGEVATGTALQPAAAPTSSSMAGMFGKTTGTEEGIGFDFTIRSRTSNSIARGDDAAETAADAQTYEVSVQKVNATQEDPQPGDSTLLTGLSAGDQQNHLLVGSVGYGDMDVAVHSRNTATNATEWDTPKVRTRWERWRNVLGNVRWLAHGAGTNVAPRWTVGAGTPTIAASTTSIAGTASGTYCGFVNNNDAIVQTVDVTGYRARAMDAWLHCYMRSTVNSPTDFINIKVEALDSGSSTLATTNSNFASVPTTNWVEKQIKLTALPANTTQLRVTFKVGTDTTSHMFFCEPELRLGTMTDSASTLTNDSFESSFTGWTNVTNSFVTDTTSASPSATYARGGAFSTSEIMQEFSVPTGWEIGSDAVLNSWRSQSKPGDTGQVVLEARDSLGNVLATTTTGMEDLGTGGAWVRRRLSLACPDGTAKLRVRLLAVRSVLGNSGAMFDDILLSLHKDLSDARYYKALKFANNSTQSIAATWQEWHIDHADLFRAGVPHPIVFGGGNGASMNGLTSRPVQMQWSDGAAHTPGYGVGIWGGTAVSGFPTATVRTHLFARGGVDFETFSEDGTFRHISPKSSEPFTMIVLFRVDEEGFATSCGLCGRRGGGAGWGLTINASGFVVATVEGTGGVANATCAVTPVADGAWHYAALVYDPVGHTLAVKTEYETVTVSTASVGEIQNTDDATPFRLGRSAATDDTLPGQIGFGYWFDATLTGPQVAAHWNLGEDPTAALASYTCPAPAWIPGARDATGAETVALVAADQVGVAYVRGTFDDLGMALAVGQSTTNRCHSFDFTNVTYWNADAGVTLTQGVVDATGRARGVTVANADTSYGLVLAWCDVAQPTVSIVFWAKANAAGSVALEVLDSLGNTKSTTPVALTTLWKRYAVQLPSWDAATPTAKIRFKSNAGTMTFSLTSVLHVEDGTNAPALIPRLAGAAMGGETFGTFLDTLPDQFNAEGELIIDAMTPTPAPTFNTSLLYVDNTVNNGNSREFRMSLGTLPGFIHGDSGGFPNTSGTSALDPSQGFTLRGRWCSISTLDNAANPFAGLVTVGSVSGSNYGRSSTWTYDQMNGQRVRIGTGPRGAFQGFIHRVVVRAREEKLL